MRTSVLELDQLAGDPDGAPDGAVWYDGQAGALRCRHGGASKSLSAAHAQVEIDFGNAPAHSAVFVIVDPAVSPSSKVIAQQSGDAATGKGADENEMDGLVLRCRPGQGAFALIADAAPGPVSGKFKIDYIVG